MRLRLRPALAGLEVMMGGRPCCEGMDPDALSLRARRRASVFETGTGGVASSVVESMFARMDLRPEVMDRRRVLSREGRSIVATSAGMARVYGRVGGGGRG